MADWLRSGRRRALRNTIVVVLVAAAVVAVSLVLMKTRAEAASSAAQAERYTAPSFVPPTPAPLPVVAIIGDDSTSRAASGVAAGDRWTALLAEEADVDVRTYASAGSGYLADGADGRNFVDQASRVPQDAEIVIVFGGIADALSSESQLSRAVSRTISTIQSRAPRAKIAIVGPVTSDGRSADVVTAERTLLTNAVGAFGLQLIDPIQRAWFSRDYRSGAQLGTSEQQTLAKQFGVIVGQLTPSS